MLSRTTRKSNNEDGRNSNSEIESIDIKEEFLFDYPPSSTGMHPASPTGIQTESPNISETSKRIKRKSAIWNYFTKIGNNRLAECIFCSSRLSYKTSISNLAKHLKSKHTVECQKKIFKIKTKHAVAKKKADPFDFDSGPSSSTFWHADPSSIIKGPHDIIDNLVIQNNIPCRSISVPQFENEIDASLDESSSTNQHPTDQRHPTEQQIDKLIMNLFIKDFQSLDIVEGKGFKELIEHAFPLYPFPSVQYFKHSLIEKATALEQVIQDKIKDAQSVCITVENWKPNTNISYVTISAHFIIEFKLETILIDIISDFDSMERLADEVYNAIRKRGIDKKVLSLVTNEFDIDKDIWKHSEYVVHECFVYFLNIFIDQCIESNQEIMVMKDSFKVFCEVLTCHRPKFLEFVEWYCIYDMLNCFIKEKDQVPDFERNSLERLKLNKTVDLDWTLCEQLCYVLKPCMEVIEEINTHTFVSGSLVNPLIFGLKKSLENLTVLPIIENFWKKLINEVTNFSDILKGNEIFNTAMFLDPRFKLYFDDLDIANTAKDKVINLVTDLIGKEGDKLDELDAPPKKKVSSVWQHYEKTMQEIAPERNTESRARSEVEKYLAEQVLLVSESSSPLDWWKEREKVYPFLSQVAMLNLNAMATCVPGNRFYSPYQLTLHDRKAMIEEPYYLKDLVFLNQHNS